MAKKPKIAPRKPGAPDASAQRFVAGDKTSRRQAYSRGEMARFTAYMTADLKKRFDLWCLEHDQVGSDVVASLVETFLDEQTKSK